MLPALIAPRAARAGARARAASCSSASGSATRLRAPAGRAVGRRAAAGGGGARGDAPAAAAARRRADRQPRPGDRRARARAAARAERARAASTLVVATHNDRLAAAMERTLRLSAAGSSPRPSARRRAGASGDAADGAGTRGDAVRACGCRARWRSRWSWRRLLAGCAGRRRRSLVRRGSRADDAASRGHAASASRATSASRRTPSGSTSRPQPGSPFDQDAVDKDIRAIYAMGFFDQVNAERDARGRQGRRRDVPGARAAAGAQRHRRGQREAEEGGGRRRAPRPAAHHPRPREGPPGHRGREEALRRQGLPRREDRPTRPSPVGENEVDVTLHGDGVGARARQGHRVRGQRGVLDRKLRGLLQTKEAWILTPFTGAGNLNQDVLRTDVERLTAWYYDHGYVTVRIDEPKVERRDDGLGGRHQDRRGRAVQDRQGRRSPARTCPSDPDAAAAGPRDQAGRGVQRQRAARRRAAADRAPVRGRLRVRQHRARDRGRPRRRRWSTSPSRSSAASPVTVDRIEVTGNTKTRDYVVRREMRLQEQELFSATQAAQEPRGAAAPRLLPGGERHHPQERRRRTTAWTSSST